MKIKSKATGAEQVISDEAWAQMKAQGLQSKFTVTKASEAPAEVKEDVSSTDVETTPKQLAVSGDAKKK